MLDLKLSTLSIILGLLVAVPSIFGLLKPKAFADAVRKFPRQTAVGYVLMLLGTVWFLYNVSQESVSDFAAMKKIFYTLFMAIGIGCCFFVQDYLPVRGLAVLLLLLAKLMVDTARWEPTDWRLVIATWAYVMAIAGMWFTFSPWRLRDLLNWSVATESRTRATNGIRVAFGLFIVVLGLTVFKSVEKHSNAASLPPHTHWPA
jgi:multisubunit Na+/H+ antiporter MnhB subunit